MKKREESLIKNAIILAFGTFFPKFASFVSLPVLTACLTHEEYGTYDLVVVLVSLFLPIITLQIHTAAFRFLIDCRDSGHEKERVITNIFAFIIPVSLIALVVLFLVLHDYSYMVRFLICTYFFFDVMANSARQVARGLSLNTAFSISASISAFGQILFVLVFVLWLKKGLIGCMAALIVSEVLSTVFLMLRAGIYKYLKVSSVDSTEIKRLLTYSWPMVPNALSMWVMQVSDRLVVSVFLGVASNAIYAVANKLPSIMTLAQTSIVQAWQENASQTANDKDVGRYYSKTFNMVFGFTAGLLSLLVSLSPLLFKILVKGNYDAAYTQLPILFMSMLFFSMASFLGGIYVAFYKTKSIGITTVVAAALNLVIDISLIRYVGLYAASLSTLLSYIFLFTYRLLDVKKFVNIVYDFKHIAFICAALVLQCIIFWVNILPLNVANFAISIVFFLIWNRTLVKSMINKLKETLKR